MRLSRTIVLTACAPALLLFLSAARTDRTPQEMKTLMTERGKLLFSDDFAAGAVSREWKIPLGKWEIVDGALKGTELEKDHHPAVIRHAMNYHDAVFQFSFRLEGAKAINLSLNNQGGHICRVVINPSGFTLRRDNPKADSPEAPAVLDTVKAPIKPGQWYDMIVEIQGKRMLARIDDSHIGYGKHDAIDVDKKDFGLPMSGDSAYYDNVRVWEATPKADWDESKLEAKRQPAFTNGNELVRPTGYREWIFVGSSLGMGYREGGGGQDPAFHNVYIQPEAYRAYANTGKFPDKTMLVMELTTGSADVSINKQGKFEDRFIGIEAAVKDESRFPERWAYFNFIGNNGAELPQAKAFPKDACWSCHNAHGAADNVFVQFYPVLKAARKR